MRQASFSKGLMGTGRGAPADAAPSKGSHNDFQENFSIQSGATAERLTVVDF